MRFDPRMTSFHRMSLSDPPRRVPFSVRLRILLGGFLNQFGWYFFGFGMVFVWAFGGSSALYDLAYFQRDVAVTEGRISAVIETNMSINEERVYEYQYAYRVNGVEYFGATKAYYGEHKVNDPASVEYTSRNPTRSRIQGLEFKRWVALVAGIFPMIGLVFIALGIRKGIRGARLLRHGKQTTGTLVSQEPTNTEVNDEPVFEFTFEFEVEGEGFFEVVARTHLTERFAGEESDDEDDVREPLLYNPYDPNDAILLDDLPGGPRIDERGEIRGVTLSLLPSLIIPGVTVVGHGYWVLYLLELL